MVANRQTVYEMALKLSPADREALAEDLYRSLHGEEADAVEAAWVEEAHRRLDGLEQGRTKAIPIERVFPDWEDPK